METTRHFTATVYLVHDGATALHHHPGLGIRLPPGGHVDRDELPHETALREAREETGLEPTLLTDHREVASETSRSRWPPGGSRMPSFGCRCNAVAPSWTR